MAQVPVKKYNIDFPASDLLVWKQTIIKVIFYGKTKK